MRILTYYLTLCPEKIFHTYKAILSNLPSKVLSIGLDASENPYLDLQRFSHGQRDPAYSNKVKRAEAILIRLMKKGMTYTEAANEASERYPEINYNTLRNRAFYLCKAKKIYPIGHKTHNPKTPHGKLISKWRKKLLKRGFIIIDRQHHIKKCMEELGSEGNPDLFALRSKTFENLLKRVFPNKRDPQKDELRRLYPTKKQDIMLIEIVEKEKSGSTLVNQIQRYSKVGRLTIVFPMNVGKIEFAGGL